MEIVKNNTGIIETFFSLLKKLLQKIFNKPMERKIPFRVNFSVTEAMTIGNVQFDI